MSMNQDVAFDRRAARRGTADLNLPPRVVAFRRGEGEIGKDGSVISAPPVASPRTAIPTGRVARSTSPKAIVPEVIKERVEPIVAEPIIPIAPVAPHPVIEASQAAVIEAAPAPIVPRSQRTGTADAKAIDGLKKLLRHKGQLSAPKAAKGGKPKAAEARPVAPKAKKAARPNPVMDHLRTLVGKPIVPANKPLSKKELAKAEEECDPRHSRRSALQAWWLEQEALREGRRRSFEARRAHIIARIEALDTGLVLQTDGLLRHWQLWDRPSELLQAAREASGNGTLDQIEVPLSQFEWEMKQRPS